MVSVADQHSSNVYYEKRKPICPPKKLQRIKPSLTKDFPSKVSLITESSSLTSESEGKSGSLSGEAGKYDCLGKPPITYWRQADANDVDIVYDLIQNADHRLDDLFNQPDVPDLIEKSVFSIAQFNVDEDLISFTCLFAYPNIPAVPSFDWFIWMVKLYSVEGITPMNAFFLHYMTWKKEYYEEFLSLTLETIFMEYPFLKFIILIKPPIVKLPDLFSEYFVPVLPRDVQEYNWDVNSVQIMFLCLRHSLLDRLKIRLAIVEDHDDLMPIIERQTDKLRALYGDFCMAEIIEFPGTEERKTLVCEVKGYAAAFMTLNRSVDLELLNTQFDLGVFHGLRKPSEFDKKVGVLEDDSTYELHLPTVIKSSYDLIDIDTINTVMKWRPEICEFSSSETPDDLSVESDDGHGLSLTVANLIRDSMNLNIKPKFSGNVLGIGQDERPGELGEYGERGSSIKTDLSLISLQHYNLPEYHGHSNAFRIELFAVHEDFDEKLCMDFLEAAFELFPDLDYCLLTVPSQSMFPLLELFVRVTPRPLKRFKQELYVCHKSSVMLTFMRVRKANKSDLPEIDALLTGIRKRDIIYADVANACIFPDSAYQGFVLVCNQSIVGVSVVCNETGLEYLYEHFRVSDFIDFNLHKIDYHGILKHLVLSPIYQTHARFFLRDTMRMADLTALYRARYEETQGEWVPTSLITVLGQLVPVKPKRMVNYHLPSLGVNVPPPYLLSNDLPFSLFHINSRICGVRKQASNINLVVVGASRTAYSFLENLLYAPSSAYVTYNNITWVSPHGTGSESPPHEARDSMFPYRGKYDRRYKAQICLSSFVNFVYGFMTEINRTEKYIIINNDAIVRYDYLVLLCGRQYLIPIPLTKEKDMTSCRRGSRPRCSLFKYLIDQKVDFEKGEEIEHPSNIFLINSVVDATNALVSLHYLINKRKNVRTKEKIIIYGQELIAYLCIQSLLKFGVKSELIAFVEPVSKNTPENVFHDPQVDEAVTEILKEMKIDHYRGYNLYKWTFCEGNQIKTATFHSQHRKVTLRCMAMLPFEGKMVSEVTFKALNEASLVYDGRLVINYRFRTNDPFIYAAGPLTKYQRKYFAKDKRHEYYSSTEVGKVLAEIIRAHIDPTQTDKEPDPNEELPNLQRPLFVFGKLPGDWNYCHIRSPGKEVPLEVRCNVVEFGDTLITGDCKMSKGYGYFNLHLDDYGFVESITCFTKDEIDLDNLPVLFGKHEKYLNNLLLRYDLGLIKDFFSYFREPWVYGLYYDQFKYVMRDNATLFDSEESRTGKKRIVDLIADALKKSHYKALSENVLNEIKETFETSEVKTRITKNVVEYLTVFDQLFPMYATPRILRVLLHGATTSLLHKSMLNDSSRVEYSSDLKMPDIAYRF